jgi:hypothetical protein
MQDPSKEQPGLPPTGDDDSQPHAPVLGTQPIVKEYHDADPYTADHRDYLLNQSRVNLMAISQMSDLKANLMLTLSAVMLQFALVKVSDHDMSGPMVHYWVIVVGALFAILFSAYSTLPKAPLRSRELPPNTPVPNSAFLLFFTSYIRLPLADYKRHMNHILSTPPLTHDAIMEELHAHGRYISRKKYLPLRLAYITFLMTWIAGAVMYLTAP